MRYLLVVLLMLGMVFAGCSSGSFVAPVLAGEGDTADIWPIFYGTDNGGPDNGYMAFYDQAAVAWQTPRLIANDLLDSQWTPQRNGVGWDTAGKWNVSFIETGSNDLEIWESPDSNWQDDAGAWTLTDDDATYNYEAVDIESRQGFIWSMLQINLVGLSVSRFSINLETGAPNWSNAFGGPGIVDNAHYSYCLDDSLVGHGGCLFIESADLQYVSTTTPSVIVESGVEYPQLLFDLNKRAWAFYTDVNKLYCETAISTDTPGFLPEGANPTLGVVYVADILNDDYHITWLALDDTIHVALVDDHPLAANDTHLIYLRRTPNGWSAPVTLLTVNGAFGTLEYLSYPQICVDSLGNIFISYIKGETNGSPSSDLQGFYLDADDYNDFTTVGNWAQSTDIDDSSDLILWAEMPDSFPHDADM